MRDQGTNLLDTALTSPKGDPGPRKAYSARRLSACLKACQGIPLDALESNVIVRLAAACVRLRDPLVTEILEEMSPARSPCVGRGVP